ncbi:MAG: thiamine phosphate synthase [Azospirillaceae bacterium]
MTGARVRPAPPRPGRRVIDLSVMLVTDPVQCAGRGIAATVTEAVAGGATCIQLRDKTADDAELTELARELMAALAGTGVALIVNDRLAVAQAAGADGLHVGQGDGRPAEARARLGAAAIIGVSAHDEVELAAIDPAVVDYVGTGPLRATKTKPDHEPPLGPARLAALRALAPVPMVAIGGVTAEDAPALIGAGIDGLAVVSAICAADDPRAAARRLAEAVAAARAAKTPGESR